MKITGWRITNNCFAKITVVGGLNGNNNFRAKFSQLPVGTHKGYPAILAKGK